MGHAFVAHAFDVSCFLAIGITFKTTDIISRSKMQSVGRHIVRSGLSSEVLNQSKNVGVRSLGTAKPDPATDPAKERQAKKAKGLEKKATHSKSFVQNMFRGMIQSEQAFPFPKVLDEEQAENLAMLVEPTEKFMTEVNDPAWNDTNEKVHPNLNDVAAQVCKNTEMFGNSVEKLLIKHGKRIIGEQFLLNRLAAAAIDIYATTCMLSRCTQSLNEGRPSAMH